MHPRVCFVSLLILYTTVILIASFASVFNGNICLSKQDDGCTALIALTGIQGLFHASEIDGDCLVKLKAGD